MVSLVQAEIFLFCFITRFEWLDLKTELLVRCVMHMQAYVNTQDQVLMHVPLCYCFMQQTKECNACCYFLRACFVRVSKFKAVPMGWIKRLFLPGKSCFLIEYKHRVKITVLNHVFK